MNAEFWRNKSVLVTGHTGFKGGWLSLWLDSMGANVSGYSLDPISESNFFDCVGLKSLFEYDFRCDIRDISELRNALEICKPEIIFHLAAQSLVKVSYEKPIDTFSTNIMGTVNLLAVARHCDFLKTIVLVTTDKVYENKEDGKVYSESDRLGGHDPYSTSKAASEIVISGFQKSYFSQTNATLRVATARSGNVIGGGDWSLNRIIPDCVRSFHDEKAVIVRKPDAIRPWQHVLDPLMGYLNYAEYLYNSHSKDYIKSCNFAPNVNNNTCVIDIVNSAAKIWGESAQILVDKSQDNVHEATLLKLDSALARHVLDYAQRWDLKTSLYETIAWYKNYYRGCDMKAFSLNQINQYSSLI